jgi:hypothetical protein
MAGLFHRACPDTMISLSSILSFQYYLFIVKIASRNQASGNHFFLLLFKKEICYNPGMERRRTGRVSVSIRAERISGSEKYSVFIEDISENGIHMIIAPAAAIRECAPGAEISLRLELATGKTILLRCITRWAYHLLPPEKEVQSIGLEIVDPPKEYMDFVRALSHSPAL